VFLEGTEAARADAPLADKDLEVVLIIERWSRRAVQEQPNAQRVHHAVLIDHLHDFLWTLGHSLMESEASKNGQHCLPATVHGEKRWETGWSLAEVVRDYQILRLVILDKTDQGEVS
jgi:hypothetical protein